MFRTLLEISKYIVIGMLMLIPSTIIGVIILYDTQQGFHFDGKLLVVNFVIWITSIVLIIMGSKRDYKNKQLEKQNIIKKESEKELKKEDEIKKLKEKVEALEKDKERKD